MYDLRLELFEHAQQMPIGESIPDRMDRSTQGGDFDHLQASTPALLQQPTFWSLGGTCDQDHLVVELLL
jgi:hypothetical protein